MVWNGGGGQRPYYFPSTPGTVTSNIFTLLFSVTKYVHHFPDRRLLLFCALCFVMLFVCVRLIFDKAGAPFGLCAWCGVALTRQTRVRVAAQKPTGYILYLADVTHDGSDSGSHAIYFFLFGFHYYYESAGKWISSKCDGQRRVELS